MAGMTYRKAGSMKRLVMVVAVVACGLVRAQDVALPSVEDAAVAGEVIAESRSEGPAPVVLAPMDGGSGMVGAMDVAGGPGRTARAWDWIKTHKVALAGTAAGLLVTDRVSANNDWLWYAGNSSKSASTTAATAADATSSAPAPGSSSISDSTVTTTSVNLDVSGDNNTVIVNSQQGSNTKP